jgi:predicted transcriptional regulator of viral defense system
MKAAEYINQLLSFEEYSFSTEEITKNTKIPESTVLKELNRLQKKGEIVCLRKGFYLILPPRYRNLGKLPLQLYVDKLFKFLGRDYYVALFSAAQLHGAAHQRIQQDYIITTPPSLRDISSAKCKIRFFKTNEILFSNIVELKSDAGRFNVSSPALTAIDLIHYQNKIGGLNRIMPIFEELIEAISLLDVQQLLKTYSNTSSVQRLGYLMELCSADKSFTDLINETLAMRNFFPVLLCPVKGEKAGAVQNRWKVSVNQEIETDL